MLFTSETYLTRHDKVTDVCTTNICDTEIGFSITGRTKKKPRNTRTSCEMCSKLTIYTPKRRHWHHHEWKSIGL